MNFITNLDDQQFCKSIHKTLPLLLAYSLYTHKKAENCGPSLTELPQTLAQTKNV